MRPVSCISPPLATPRYTALFLLFSQCDKMCDRAGGAHTRLTAVVVDGDQALLEPPGAYAQAAGATKLLGHRPGDAIAACGGEGIPGAFCRADEQFILGLDAVDEREG